MNKTDNFYNFNNNENLNFDYNLFKLRFKKTIKISFVSIFLIIIMLMGCVVFFKPNNVDYLYFIKIDSFTTYKQASNCASSIQNLGGAGYVYFDGSYSIIASYYSNKKSADAVLKNIKTEYKNATILKLEKQKLLNLNYSSKEKSIIKETVKTTDSNLALLNDLIIQYDKNEITKQKLSLNILQLSSNQSNAYEKFLSSFKNDLKLNKAIKYLNTINECYTSIENTTESSTLKYNLVKIAVNLSYLLSSF